MGAPPGSRHLWWDRDLDHSGKPIRPDIRAAAHEIWQAALSRVRCTLGDATEAAELMEIAVSQGSRYLDRRRAPPFSANTAALLTVVFRRVLKRRASKLERLKAIGGSAEIVEYLPERSWVNQVDLRLDLEKLVRQLSDRSRVILVLRDAGYDWKEIAQLLGMKASSAKAGFWRELRRARSRMGSDRPREENRHNPRGRLNSTVVLVQEPEREAKTYQLESDSSVKGLPASPSQASTNRQPC